jgi:hypothetical protein
MNEKIASAALFCHQDQIDVPLSDSWLLKDLDNGENYLEKVIRRLQSWDLFKNIYILVGEENLYQEYRKYGGGNVKVVHMNRSDFVELPRSAERLWNMSVSGNHFIAVWLYQIQLAFNEDILFCDVGYRVFLSRSVVKKAIELHQGRNGFVSFSYDFGITALVLGKNCLAPLFTEKLTGYPRNRFVTGFGSDSLFLSEKGEVMEVNAGNFEYKPVDIGLNRKQGFDFMKMFYGANRGMDEYDFFEKFSEFFSVNRGWFEKRPFVIRIDTVDKEGHEIALNTLREIFSQASEIGRLTVILKALTSHAEKTQIFEEMRTFNLHYYLETDGQYALEENTHIAEVFDVVKFLQVDEIEVNLLQKIYPDMDAEKLFANLTAMMEISYRKHKPQVGIECTLGDDDLRSAQIIEHWKKRTTSVEEVFAKNNAVIFYPQIQFVCYFSKKIDYLNECYMQFVKPELVIDAKGKMGGGLSCSESSLLDYYKELRSGADK